MDKNIKKENNNGLPERTRMKWGPAIEISSRISGWVILPIVSALIAGKALDKHFDSKPFIFLGLTGIAFLISIFGILKVVSKYMKEIKESPDQSRGPDKGREN